MIIVWQLYIFSSHFKEGCKIHLIFSSCRVLLTQHRRPNVWQRRIQFVPGFTTKWLINTLFPAQTFDMAADGVWAWVTWSPLSLSGGNLFYFYLRWWKIRIQTWHAGCIFATVGSLTPLFAPTPSIDAARSRICPDVCMCLCSNLIWTTSRKPHRHPLI